MAREFLYFSDGKILYCPDIHKNKEVSTIKDCECEDSKTNLSCPRDSIPEGTVLQIKGVVTNFYGKFIQVNYQGITYYLKPTNLLWGL